MNLTEVLVLIQGPLFVTMLIAAGSVLNWYSLKRGEEREKTMYDCETEGEVLEEEIHLSRRKYLIGYYVNGEQYLVEYIKRSRNIIINDYIDKSHNNIIIKYRKDSPRECVIKGLYKYKKMNLIKRTIVLAILGVIRGKFSYVLSIQLKCQ